MIIHFSSGCIRSKTLICGCPNIPKMSIKPSHGYILIPNWWIFRKASRQHNMFSQTKIQKPQILTRLLDVGCSAQLTSLVWQRDTTSFGSFKRRKSSTRQRCPSDNCPKQLCQKVWMSRTWNGGDCKISFMWFWFLIIVTCSVCSIKKDITLNDKWYYAYTSEVSLGNAGILPIISSTCRFQKYSKNANIINLGTLSLGNCHIETVVGWWRSFEPPGRVFMNCLLYPSLTHASISRSPP